MKKALLTLLATALSLNAFAQTDFGIKGGANLSTMQYDAFGRSAFGNRIDYNFGCFVEYGIPQLVEGFGLRAELLYSRQGYFNDYSTEKQVSTYDFNVNYLSVPLLLQYKPSNGRLGIVLGAQYGYAISETHTTNGLFDDIVYQNQKSSGDLRYCNRHDIALVAGVGYEVWRNLGVEVRYCYGLTDYDTAQNSRWGNTSPDGKHRLVQFGAFYRF